MSRVSRSRAQQGATELEWSIARNRSLPCIAPQSVVLKPAACGGEPAALNGASSTVSKQGVSSPSRASLAPAGSLPATFFRASPARTLTRVILKQSDPEENMSRRYGTTPTTRCAMWNEVR